MTTNRDRASHRAKEIAQLPLAYARLKGLEKSMPQSGASVPADMGYDFIDIVSKIFGLMSDQFHSMPLAEDAFYVGSSGTVNYCRRSTFASKLSQVIAYLESAYSEEITQKRRSISTSARPKTQTASGDSRKVFIVHGHADALREKVARFIERLKFEAVILGDQPNSGKTVIEKFETHSDVCYAVVLLTPDDVGGEKALVVNKLRPRARQNVIFELGYFFGAHGRQNVCVLLEEGVEMPSDIQGLVWTKVEKDDGWKLRLAQEMKAAGLPVDMNHAV